MTEAEALAIVTERTVEARSLFSLRPFATVKAEDGFTTFVVGLSSGGAGEGDCWYTGSSWEEALARMFDVCDICERPLANAYGDRAPVVKHGARWEHVDCLATVIREERMLREETT